MKRIKKKLSGMQVEYYLRQIIEYIQTQLKIQLFLI